MPDENKRNAIRVMVEQLAATGVKLSDVERHFAPSKFQSFDGVLTPEELKEAVAQRYPQEKRQRWFVDHPLIDEADSKTYVLSNQWGSRTEAQLTVLSDAFPEAKVTFRAAD